MKTRNRTLCILTFAVAAGPALACSTIVVGRNASATGCVLVGHNEDDPGELYVRHAIVPPRELDRKSVV